MLEIAMTQPATKAGRNEKMTSNDGASAKSEAENSDADFDAAYSADAESEAKSATPEASKEKVADGEGKRTTAEVAENGDGRKPIETVDAGEDAVLDAAEDTKAQSAADEAPVETSSRKAPGVDASELAFAQRVRSEQGDALPLVASKKARPSEAQASEVTTTGTPQTVAGSSQASIDAKSNELAIQRQAQTNVSVGQSGASQTSGAQTDPTQTALPKVAEQTTDAQPINLPRERSRRDDHDRLATLRDTAPATNKANKAAAPSLPVATPAQQVTPLTAQVDMPPSDLQLAPISDLDAPASWEQRSASTMPLAQTLSRPETPGLIGRQMAEALQRFPDRAVELALNPKELGKVKMSISAVETGITVQVLAERPETLDLMRRNIDQLAREFQALGYESINFAFNEGQSEQGPSDQAEGGGQPLVAVSPGEAEADAPIPVTMTASTGVDIRI